MYRTLIFLLLITIASCQAPIGYINSISGSSQLKQCGDLNAKASFGADWKFSNRIYDFDLAWSPINHIGLRAHLTTNDKGPHNAQESSYERLRYIDFSLVYFSKLGSKIDYEVQFGIGNELLRSVDFKFLQNNTPQSLSPFLTHPNDYAFISRSNRFFIQPTFDFPIKNEPNLSVSIGTRFQYVDYKQMSYQSDNKTLLSNKNGNVTLDPFIQITHNHGHFGSSMMLGYTKHFGQFETEGGLSQPVHRHLYASLGLFMNLKKR